MILDITTMFSNQQSFANAGSSPVSGNVIDFLGPYRSVLGAAGPIEYEILGLETVNVPAISIRIDEPFNNLTSLAIAVETCDGSVANGTFTRFNITELYRSPAYTLAQLTPGATRFRPDRLPVGKYRRYINLRYYIVGTAPTLGRITAGLSDFEITRIN